MGKQQEDPNIRIVATNRKARHLYHIETKWEAGLVLRGTEIKSLRHGGASLVDSYAEASGREVWLNNMHIKPYDKGNRYNVDSKRRRKLLLKKSEIKRISGAITQKGYTVVALRVYMKGQYAKVEIALVTGKKEFDKRRDIKEREVRREMDRAVKQAR